MGGLDSLRVSLLLAILCFVVCNEVISSHISSEASFEETFLPKNKINIKMPGTSPQEVSFLLINKILSWLVVHLIEFTLNSIRYIIELYNERYCGPRISSVIVIASSLRTSSWRFTRQEGDYLVLQSTY